MDNNTIRILLVEDNAADARFVREMLTDVAASSMFPTNFHLVHVERLAQIHTELTQNRFDVILLDLSLPDSQGLETLSQMRAAATNMPIVVMSGLDDELVAVEAVQQGAQDYLVKGYVSDHSLARSIRYAIERKRSEEALHASEEKYRRIAAYIDDILYSVDGETQEFRYVSPAFERLLGYTLEDVRQMGGRRAFLSQIIQEERFTKQATDFERLKRLGKVDASFRSRYEAWWRSKDGALICLEDRWTPIFDNGDLVGTDGVLRDITERKQTLEALTKLSRVVEQTDDMVAITNRNGVIEYVNPAFEAQTGYTSAEAVGATPSILRSGVHGDDFYQSLWKTVLSGQVYHKTIVNRKRNGEFFYDEKTITPLRNSAGAITHFVATGRDITERRQREQELEAIATVSAALRAAATRAEMLPVILEQILDLLDADGVILAMRDEINGETVLELGSGEWGDVRGIHLSSGEGVSGHVIATGQPYVNENVKNDPRFALPDILDAIRAIACVPLSVQEQTIGALVIGYIEHPVNARIFTEEEIQVLTALADIAANAIHRATLREKTERRLEHLAALHTIDLAIVSKNSWGAILDTILEQVTSQLQVDAAAVLLLNPQTQMLEHMAHRGFYSDATERLRASVEASYAGNTILQLQPVVVPDLRRADPPFQRAELAAGEQFVAYHAAPLIVQGEVVGVLETFHRSPLEIEPEWLAFLESLAAQTAVAIENDRLATETQRLLQQTQEQTQQMQQIMESVSEGLVLLDADHRVVVANPAAKTHLSLLTGQEVRTGTHLTRLGRTSIDTLLAPLPPDAIFHQVSMNEQPAPRVFEVTAHPLLTKSEAGQWVLTLRDVTRERQIEEQVQQHERLAAVGQLAAGIAHDFNNVMGAILLHTQLLGRTEQLAPKGQQRLDIIVNQAQHASNLIRQILDFSRRSVMERSPVDLLPLLKETVKMLKSTLSENIHLELDVEPGEYVIDADLTRLQQVTMNLALNARDAMPDGGRLHFGLKRIDLAEGQLPPVFGMSAGPWLCLRVSDTGTGIPPEALPHIFEPFFSTKGPDMGTGLGLAQVYGIVKQHDGDIAVESQIGKGATFAIYLPVTGAEIDVPPPISAPQEITGTKTILLVEDNLDLREVTQEMLELLGYRVFTGADGQEALDIFRQHAEEIDLIISDLVMPQMGGVELVRSVRRMKASQKAIISTGYPLADEGEKLLREGIVDWIQKPFSRAVLAKKVSDVLNQ